jgi:hypothetical protein
VVISKIVDAKLILAISVNVLYNSRYALNLGYYLDIRQLCGFQNQTQISHIYPVIFHDI